MLNSSLRIGQKAKCPICRETDNSGWFPLYGAKIECCPICHNSATEVMAQRCGHIMCSICWPSYFARCSISTQGSAIPQTRTYRTPEPVQIVSPDSYLPVVSRSLSYISSCWKTRRNLKGYYQTDDYSIAPNTLCFMCSHQATIWVQYDAEWLPGCNAPDIEDHLVFLPSTPHFEFLVRPIPTIQDIVRASLLQSTSETSHQ